MAQHNGSARSRLNLVFAEGTGSFLVLLPIAEQQQLFAKHGIEIEPVATRGATVPLITRDTPVGLIGEPAAIMQAAQGAHLRIIASLSSTPLSGHLVARAGIKTPGDRRGKRIGVRVVGAGIWISTILALQQLELSLERDRITAVSTGSPVEIFRALEQGTIDAALVTFGQSRELQARGYTVLLADYPPDITAYGACLAAMADYIAAHPDVVQNVTAALTEAVACSLAERNRGAVMQAFNAWLGISDMATALSNLRELRPKPYPSRAALEKMQSIMAMHDPRVMAVKVEDLIDERFVRNLDESGAIARLRESCGAERA